MCRLSSAETPSVRRLACAALPGTASRNVMAPAWATITSRFDGSVMTHMSPAAPARMAASDPCPPSSSDGTKATTSSPRRCSSAPQAPSARTAPRIAATPPFMSQAPRPYIAPSRTSAPKGSVVQVAGSPIGTTSMWPDSTMRASPGTPARPMTTGRVERATSSPGQSGSSRTAAGSGWKISTSRPSASSRSARLAAIASSSPVTLGRRMSAARSSASAAGSTASAAMAAPSGSRGLRTGLMREAPGESGR